jgi:hypothetical protein
MHMANEAGLNGSSNVSDYLEIWLCAAHSDQDAQSISLIESTPGNRRWM